MPCRPSGPPAPASRACSARGQPWLGAPYFAADAPPSNAKAGAESDGASLTLWARLDRTTIPGDEIMGYLSAGKGIVVHRLDCRNVPEFRKSPERCVAIAWDRVVSGEFKVALRVVVDNRPGVLATVAAAIAESSSNIENVEYRERDASAATLLFTIEVRDRAHLAQVMRRVRRAAVVHTVHRDEG